MGLSIGSFVFCCAPIGIIGTILGIQSLRMAKRLGTPTPVGAVLGVVLGPIGDLLQALFGRIAYHGLLPMVVADVAVGFLFVLAISKNKSFANSPIMVRRFAASV